MKQKIFISFTEKDRKKMEILKKIIFESKSLIPIIIEDKRDGAKHLAELVSSGIKEADYFIPIITSNSINSQWVNQEIGFAKAIEKNIIPILENNLIEKLKGFIHNQLQLSYNYKIERNENSNYKTCCLSLSKDLEIDIIDIDIPENLNFVNQQVKNGELYIHENNTWLIIENVRYLIFDQNTSERIKQIRGIYLPKTITIKELLEIKEDQKIKSKGRKATSTPRIIGWGNRKSKNPY